MFEDGATDATYRYINHKLYLLGPNTTVLSNPNSKKDEGLKPGVADLCYSYCVLTILLRLNSIISTQ